MKQEKENLTIEHMGNKTYNISTISELLDIVNDDNIENLTIDFATWLHAYLGIMNEVKKLNPSQTKGLRNSEIASSSFVWINDGKNDLKSITITNEDESKELFKTTSHE